jgi:hypothetical protein
MALTGRCLCGDIRFTVTGAVEGTSLCHCGQCRRQAGHAWASATVAAEAVAIEGRLAWFASSAEARRGFCPRCGSVLVWERPGSGRLSVSLGSLDAPTGLRLERHIFTADKGDYYDIADDLPQRP